MSYRSYECIEVIKFDSLSKDIVSENEVETKCLKILVDSTENNNFSVHTYKLDHTNRIAISIKTFKYAIILLVTIILISYLFFLFVIGITNLNKCTVENNSAIYLSVIGFIGILRITLFFSCPFNFSESILKKLYDKLFKMLIINRCKYSYRTSKIIFKENRPFERVFFFLHNFFCSCCFSFKYKNNDILSNNNLNHELFDSYSNTKSNSNSETSAISILLNDVFFCFKCIDFKSNNSNEETINNLFKLKRSVSSDQIKVKTSKKSQLFSLKNKQNSQRSLRHEKSNDLYYINKRLRYRHNKIQKDYKIIDKRSIRYGAAHLVQLILDIFMIFWFICGNYWIFSLDIDTSNIYDIASNKNSNFQNTSTNETAVLEYSYKSAINLNYISKSKNKEIDRNLIFIQNNSNKRIITDIQGLFHDSQCNLICYQVAFSQILITYSFFIFSFIVVILFRIYRLRPVKSLKKIVESRKRADSLP